MHYDFIYKALLTIAGLCLLSAVISVGLQKSRRFDTARVNRYLLRSLAMAFFAFAFALWMPAFAPTHNYSGAVTNAHCYHGKGISCHFDLTGTPALGHAFETEGKDGEAFFTNGQPVQVTIMRDWHVRHASKPSGQTFDRSPWFLPGFLFTLACVLTGLTLLPQKNAPAAPSGHAHTHKPRR